ncbi:MAG: hypothetical protein RL106_374 [Bacteroidota bacterium]|jgi:hypothetical protein
MKFSQRLLRFMIGVIIGCSLVYIMFPNYDWLGWLPGKQIRQSIREKQWSLTETAKCEAKYFAIEESGWREVLNDGSINFDKSKVQQTNKIYYLEDDLVGVTIELLDSTANVLHIERKGMENQSPCQP